MTSSPYHICFVCLGNIVRSPLAEHLFRQHAAQAGLEGQYQVASAGTGTWHLGESPDARMRRLAARRGLNYDGRARQFRREDLDRYDLIVPMDMENRIDLLRLASTPAQQAKIHLLREFDPHGGPRLSVPDPYYDGVDAFEEVYDMIDRSVKALLDSLQAGKV